jgi:hypothetical protein
MTSRIQVPAAALFALLALAVIVAATEAAATIIHRLPAGTELHHLSMVCDTPASAVTVSMDAAAPSEGCIPVTRARVLELRGNRLAPPDAGHKHGSVTYLVRVLERGWHVGVVGWVRCKDVILRGTSRSPC